MIETVFVRDKDHTLQLRDDDDVPLTCRAPCNPRKQVSMCRAIIKRICEDGPCLVCRGAIVSKHYKESYRELILCELSKVHFLVWVPMREFGYCHFGARYSSSCHFGSSRFKPQGECCAAGYAWVHISAGSKWHVAAGRAPVHKCVYSNIYGTAGCAWVRMCGFEHISYSCSQD